MKRLLQIIIAVITMTLAVGQDAMAQGTLRGTVADNENGEAVAFANITIGEYATTTDINGLFVLNRIAAGRYAIKIHCIGYQDYIDSVSVGKGETVRLAIPLRRGAFNLETVTITDSRSEAQKIEPLVSTEQVTARQINHLPSVGGIADLAQYLQVLPGINSTGDQGGQMYVRGGAMIQNLCMIDGMEVFNPFHSIGLYSVFETDIIRSANIHTGGFGAEYGGRLSSVIDIATRDGNKYRHSGRVQIGTFGAAAIVEGPIKKARDNDPASLTYLVSAKNSYLSHTSKWLYPSMEGGLPFDYLDLYGKLTYSMAGGSRISLFGFRFDDSVNDYRNLGDFNWSNYGAGANFSLLTSRSAVIDGTVAYSNYHIALEDGSGADKYSSISGLNMKFNVSNFFGDNRLRYGFDMESNATDYRFHNAYGIRSEQQENSNTFGVYATYRWHAKRWIVEPGLRYNHYNALSEGSLEPRLAAKLIATDRLRLKIAGGIYSQIFLDARSDNDIVNLFSGFLTSAHLNKPATLRGEKVETAMQRAQHIVAGVEYDIAPHLTANIEAYYKYFGSLLNANREKRYDRFDQAYQQGGVYEQPVYYLTDFLIERGQAYGVDLSVCYDAERLYVWATYSWGHVNRSDEFRTYAPHYDRRHTLNLLATYTMGAARQWRLSARWCYGSGFPYTQTQGVYEMWTPAAISDDPTSANGQYGLFYAEPYGGRLPSYHRLDLNITRRFAIGRRLTAELSAGATNLYNRNNIFYYDRLTMSRIDQLPFLATLSAKLSW